MTSRRFSLRAAPVALTAAVVLAAPRAALAASDEVQLFVPLAFFACVAVVAALVMVGYHRYTVQRHETLRAMIDKGMQIPPELLGEAGPRGASPRRDLRRGILLVATGLGLGLFLLIGSGVQECLLGLIPAFIGAGYLVLYRLATREPKLDTPVQVT